MHRVHAEASHDEQVYATDALPQLASGLLTLALLDDAVQRIIEVMRVTFDATAYKLRWAPRVALAKAHTSLAVALVVQSPLVAALAPPPELTCKFTA